MECRNCQLVGDAKQCAQYRRHKSIEAKPPVVHLPERKYQSKQIRKGARTKVIGVRIPKQCLNVAVKICRRREDEKRGKRNKNKKECKQRWKPQDHGQEKGNDG